MSKSANDDPSSVGQSGPAASQPDLAQATSPAANGKNSGAAKSRQGGAKKNTNKAGAKSNTKKAGESTQTASALFGAMRHNPEQISNLFRNGTYPYKTRIHRNVYEKHKEELQVELLKVQSWVKTTGQRIIVLFEGRDAAGKGGTIKRFMEHLNPRAAQSRRAREAVRG